MDKTLFDHVDSRFPNYHEKSNTSDGPIILSETDDAYQAKFAITLDGIIRPTQNESPQETNIARRSAATLMQTLIHCMRDGQEIDFLYSWHGETCNPAFAWQVLGSATGEEASTVLDQARDLFHSIQFALGNAAQGAFSWAPSHSAGRESANNQYRYAIRPDWFSIAALGGPSVGFTSASVATATVRIAQSTASTDRQIDSVMAIGPTGLEGVTVAVKTRPVELSASEKTLLAATVSQINDRGIGEDVFKSSGNNAIVDKQLIASTIDRLERWLNKPVGCRFTCMISADKPVPDSVLATIGSQLFPTKPVLTKRIEAAKASENGSAADLDLSDCFHQSEQPLSLLPGTKSMEALGIARLYAAPSSVLPKEGLVIGHGGKSGQARQVRIHAADRSRHCYVLGGTGTGKSTLLLNMIAQDVECGEGLCLIDPHGDLYEGVLGAIPEHRAKDVIALDFGDPDYVASINFLECHGPNRDLQENFVVNDLMSIFGRLYDMNIAGGPVFEMYMRNALLAVLGVEEFTGTLLDVVRFLENSRFRRGVLERSKNTYAVSFYKDQAEKVSGDLSMANVAPYITSKLNQFTHNALLRPIVGQAQSTINFRSAMDDGKIVIINLSKGTLGELDARLLGMLLVGRLFSAALSRATLNESERRPFFLYIDEFQNLATSTVVSLLSEARKYGLSLIMANQHLTQLSDEKTSRGLVQAILGNVATLLAFRTGPDDADILESYTKPQVNAGDLQNLPNFHAACRMINNNNPVPPFVFQTHPHKQNGQNAAIRTSVANSILDAGKRTYLRPRNKVNDEILRGR